MSTTTTASSSSSSLGLPENPHWKTSIHHHHGRHDSGELDVFEAAGYYNSTASPTERKILRGGEKEQPPQNWRWERRFSLDVPLRTPSPIPQNQTPQIPKQDKKPHHTSPAGRLASFLNSLFNQAASNKEKKKKKKKKSSSKSLKDSTEDESPSTLYSSSISGFRTPPPPYSNSTPNKSYYSNTEDLRTQSSQRLQIKSRVQLNPSADSQTHHTQHKRNGGISWLHEKLKLGSTSNNGVLAKPQKKSLCNGSSDKVRNKSEEKEFSKLRALGNNDDDDDDDDDGVESDSSSDLFELENYDLGFYSSGGLPVYETTRMESISRAGTVSSVPL